MSDDHRELIERAREAVEACQIHMRARDHLPGSTAWGDRDRWDSVHLTLADDVPGLASLIARLAEALEQAKQAQLAQYQHDRAELRSVIAEAASWRSRAITAERERDRALEQRDQAEHHRNAARELLEGPVSPHAYWIGCRVCLRGCVRRSDGGPVPKSLGYGHVDGCPVPAALAALTAPQEAGQSEV